MENYKIIFICIYLLVLLIYFYTETTGKLILRGPNKALLSLLFFSFAAYQFSKNYSLNNSSIILMAALFMALMGDIFLLFDLNRGGDFFLCGNICFFIYYLTLFNKNGLVFNNYWFIIPIVIVLLIIWTLLFIKLPNIFKLGKMKYPMVFYLSSITLHGITGLISLFLLKNNLLLGLGSFIFMLSDYELVIDKFVIKNNKWLLRLNSLLYFVGLLLIVLSI